MTAKRLTGSGTGVKPDPMRALWMTACAGLIMLCGTSAATAQSQDEIDWAVGSMGLAVERDRLLEWLRTGAVDPNAVLGGVAAFDNVTLMHRASVDHLDVLNEAIRQGGDCNLRDSNGATPLHWAASQWNLGPGPEALRLLSLCEAKSDLLRPCDANGLDCSADPNARDRRGRTPLHNIYEGVKGGAVSASGGARGDVLLALLEDLDADPNIKDNDGDTPLMLIIQNPNFTGAVEHVNLLLQYGADPNIKYADPNIKYNDGDTPLTLIIKKSNDVVFPVPAEIVTLLLQYGADPNARNDSGSTPLIEAVSPNRSNLIFVDNVNARIVRVLLQNGADPDLRAHNGDTPLIRAAKHEDDSVYEIRALLAGGADPCLRDRRGRIAHQHAEEAGAELSMRELEKAGGYMGFVLSLNRKVCAADMLEENLAAGTDNVGVDQRTIAEDILKEIWARERDACDGCPEMVDMLEENLPEMVDMLEENFGFGGVQ